MDLKVATSGEPSSVQSASDSIDVAISAKAAAHQSTNRRHHQDWADADWDILIIGGGNAAVASAMAAADAGARTLVLERAPRHMRGGNSRHTRNIRCVHGRDDYTSTSYSFDEFWVDLGGVGAGPNDEALAAYTIAESAGLPQWMIRHGARWQQPLAGTLQLGRTNRFFLGGGKALLNSYYRHLATSGSVTIVYEAMVQEIEIDGLTARAAVVEVGGRSFRVATRAVVCACGGFEANIDWLRRYWGSAADNYLIRGTPYNDGHILARLYAAGARKAGQERGFHAIAIDARAPKFDGGIATRLDTIPFGIVVNSRAERFYDEGEDIWPKRYAIWGRLIAEQPDQQAFSIWDSRVDGSFVPPMGGATSAGDIGELGRLMGLDPATLHTTIESYNAAVVDGLFDMSALDSCRTSGLKPEKSHWAQRLDRPPFFAIEMRPGITFTYMGVAVDQAARVQLQDGTQFRNIFAAGEIMSGNILSTGYLAGFGMTIGTVWGRTAGSQAAKTAKEIM